MARTTFLVSVSLFVSAVLARTVEYNLKISNGKIAPDGVERDATLVNGGYPGPLIFANKGDTLKVKVQNKLTNPDMYRTTSIHWHGLLQHRNADDDGPAFVTQCPIVPQASYTYTMPLGDQTGTYWYHSHLSSQYVDGLRGPLVIYDPKDPHRRLYDIDDEKTVLIIGDWYHTSSKAILATGNITLQQPDSATINGKGRFDPDNTPANPNTLYTLKVKRGKRYRLRVINSSAIASFRMSIQGHKMTVIAADGVSTKPYQVDSFDILAGQRIDAVVEANQEPDTYWINAPLTNVANKTAQALLIYEDDRRPYHPPKGPYRKWSVSEAIIKYWKHKHGRGLLSGHGGLKARMMEGSLHLHGRRDIVKRQNETTTVVMDETKLVPLEHPGAACGSKPADLVIDLTFGVNFTTGHWMINGIPHKSPDMPTLLKILTDTDGVTESDFTQPEHTIILPKNKCVEFNIKGNSGLGIVHPIHLHGHTFDVVQFGNNPPNYVNPPRRDVVGATDEGVRFQFKTDNPGPWFLHCHIDWHLEEGFAMVFAEAPEAIKGGPKSVPVDRQWKDLCRKYGSLPAGFL
uniref:Laccase-3 n=1 Tax=Thanatephorus cucumeris TaxID=107832 RepID=LAC3_THACU|nr:RecName: Full=Laccase-3; AltName: Full=Benzenediol:oxygen oxidoreductase 3; AltName: Full=Diphenol oxidase 3; AltName: Full=Urishiol oxidase 3; Flags: Precursor [Thanatephorus cucumeris]CAA90942.1 laccase [Thanatephorus cucumeris]